MACQSSTVIGNTITDATDGAIVVFGAPNSLITNNTIVANTRVLMGGINLVDRMPFYGSFQGTVISNNNIIANSSSKKIFLAPIVLFHLAY